MAVCAIAREEARYLDEWLAYHLLKGVQHFYLRYDPKSQDYPRAMEILGKWEGLGMVTVEYEDTRGKQGSYYRNVTCEKIQHEAQWCAYIDLDEFMWTADDKTNNLPALLQHYGPLVDAINLDWVFFGSNGQQDYEEGLMVERFPNHQGLGYSLQTEVWEIKTILQFNPLVCEKLKEFPSFSAHGVLMLKEPLRRLDGNLQVSESVGTGREAIRDFGLPYFALCHYNPKSMGEYLQKLSRPSAASGEKNRLALAEAFARKDKSESATHSLAAYGPMIRYLLMALNKKGGKS